MRDDEFFPFVMMIMFVMFILPTFSSSSYNDDCIVIENIVYEPEIVTTDSDFMLSYTIRNECELDVHIILKVQDVSDSRSLVFDNINLKSGVTLYNFAPDEERVYYNKIRVKRSIAQYDFPINISVYGHSVSSEDDSKSRTSEIFNIKIAREM